MSPLRTIALLLALLPAVAEAKEIETHELPSGKSYTTFKPRGLPEKPFTVLWLSSKEKSGEAAANAWKERHGALPVMAIFPNQEGNKGWRCYDWEWQKIVKDRELGYLVECVTDHEREWDIPKRRIIVAGDGPGGDYAFELALRYPDRFAAAIAVVPTWCPRNRFESENAPKARFYFLVGEKDDRKKQAQDAFDRLRKRGCDICWCPVAGLGHEMPSADEIGRAVRWVREVAEPSEGALDWATKEWESGSAAVGITVLAKLKKDKKAGDKARKILEGIEKQAEKELDAAQRQPKYSQIEELWKLHDRYSALGAVYDGVLKALSDAGAEQPVAEKPPPPEPQTDDETVKIVSLGQRAQTEKRAKDYAKAIETLKEMVAATDRADLGAGEKKQLEISARYELARCYALSGKKQSSIEELTKAVDLGYSDWKQIDSDKELDSIRGEGAFQSLSARRSK